VSRPENKTDTLLKFRKGEKNEKDLFVELWKPHFGVVKAKKISDKVSFIYNDSVFGGISWSKDCSKIVFIGEKVEPTYKSYWGEEEKKEEAKKEEEKKEEHFQSQKYDWNPSFGETLTNKKRPAIFVFDLEKFELNELWGLDSGFPAFP
jgi:acylaminoacyl-peptidase